MKILLITTTYPTPWRPRQGAFNRSLVDALRKRHDVQVIAPVPWPQVLRARAAAREPQVRHPIYYYPPKILRASYDQFYWHSVRRTLDRLASDFVPQVVLGYWLHPDGAVAVRAAERLRVPVIVMSGGSDLRLLAQHPARRGGISRVLHQADHTVVFSQELSNCAQQLGVSGDRVSVIYRSVDRARFYPRPQLEARRQCGVSPTAVVVFWAGRLDAVKNPQLLLEAAVAWKTYWGEQVQVVMAGDGPLRASLLARRDQLQLQDTVCFVGNLTQTDLASWYNAANVTALTSHSEGLPNVLQESIACGTPFVATDVGGVSEIATPGLDRLVPAGNVAAFSRAVIECVEQTAPAERSFVPCTPDEMRLQLDHLLAKTTRGPAGEHESGGSSGALPVAGDLASTTSAGNLRPGAHR